MEISCIFQHLAGALDKERIRMKKSGSNITNRKQIETETLFFGYGDDEW
jgi:hypothetical protein